MEEREPVMAVFLRSLEPADLRGIHGSNPEKQKQVGIDSNSCAGMSPDDASGILEIHRPGRILMETGWPDAVLIRTILYFLIGTRTGRTSLPREASTAVGLS